MLYFHYSIFIVQCFHRFCFSFSFFYHLIMCWVKSTIHRGGGGGGVTLCSVPFLTVRLSVIHWVMDSYVRGETGPVSSSPTHTHLFCFSFLPPMCCSCFVLVFRFIALFTLVSFFQLVFLLDLALRESFVSECTLFCFVSSQQTEM